MLDKEYDVVIIGGGPSGTIAACLLLQQGHRVKILEKTHFPRFVIGESLLPQSLQVLEKAGCLDAVEATGFQVKTGATFKQGSQLADIVFDEKFSVGPGYAYHVERSQFDLLLVNEAKKQGANVLFGATVTAINAKLNDCVVTYQDETDREQTVTCRFILDASGYGRVLPRLLGIDQPSSLPARGSLFTHVKDNIKADSLHQRNTTLITIHPRQNDIWYWLISFANGRSSVGAVGNLEYLKPYQQQGLDGLKAIINEDKELAEILENAEFDSEQKVINSYSGSVSDFYGDGFAVLGNAGEFLDPVFSSGVTAAVNSSDLAVMAVDKTLKNQPVDWQKDYVDNLLVGVEVFRKYVNAWYDGSFQKVIFADIKSPDIKMMIASILAGYAWDKENPFVKQLEKLDSLSYLVAND